MTEAKNNIVQLALEFPNRPSLGREDFLVSPCNQEAVALIDAWPDWPYFAVCVYGDEGSGKTHLANVFANKVALLTNFPYRIPFIRAAKINRGNLRSLFDYSKCLVVEELDGLQDEEALFHLYNLFRDEGGNILFTSSQAPARLDIKLPDLRSRLNIVPAAEIREPDDELLSALLVKLFMDRQVTPSPEVIHFMVNNMQRSFAFARRLVTEVDNVSLARKRAVSINIVKEALANIAARHQAELF